MRDAMEDVMTGAMLWTDEPSGMSRGNAGRASPVQQPGVTRCR